MNQFLSLFFFLVLMTSSCVPAQNNANTSKGIFKVYPKEKYVKDLNQLIYLLKENHPIPFEFTNEEDFLTLVTTQRNAIDSTTAIGEFYWICRKIVAAIGCGHTRVTNPRIQFPDSLRFPIQAQFIDSKLFVINSLTNGIYLNKGDEILTINGQNVAKIKAEIFKYLPADGQNQSNKDAIFNRYFNAFLSYHLGLPEKYVLEIVGKEEAITLNQSKVYPSIPTNSLTCEEQLCFKIENEKTAQMTIKGFVFYDRNFGQFKSFIDTSFEQLNQKKIKHLILDLRGNGGGSPLCTSYLLEHLSEKEFPYFMEESFIEPVSPNPNSFKGEVYILMDGFCFSSTPHFLALAKFHKIGTLIGTEAGGTYTCNDNSQTFELPHTKLSLRVARNTFQVAVNGFPKDKGVMPDITISPSLEDLINGKDRVVEFTMEKIDSLN